MHARAVVTEDRLGHEGRRLAVAPRGVLDDVLELHHVVGGLEQLVEAVVDLRLAGGADLVVGALDVQARLLELDHHLVAQLAEVVGGGDGEVAALVLHLVAAVVVLERVAGVPGAGDRVDLVEAGVLLGLEPHVVEDVELSLGGEERGVADPRRAQVGHRLLGDVARVAGVGLTGQRVVDEEVDDQGLGDPERVDVGGRRVREELHVGLVDGLEATDRGAVETEAILEHALVERRDGHREVLHDAGQVAETDVDHLDALVLQIAKQLVAVLEHSSSLVVPDGARPAELGSEPRCHNAPRVVRTYERTVSRPYRFCFCDVTGGRGAGSGGGLC